MRCTSVLCLLWLAISCGPALGADALSSTPSAGERPAREFERLKLPSPPTLPQPRVQLAVTGRQPFEQGEPVVLTAGLEPASIRVEYQFNFGDGSVSGWTKENGIRHEYAKPGRYLAFVQVRPALHGRLAKTKSPGLTTSERVVVQVVEPPEPPARGSIRPIEPPKPRPQPRVQLAVTGRQPFEQGEPVVLTAGLEPASIRVEYQFNFGDGSVSGWTKENGIRHEYAKPGRYLAFVQVRPALHGARAGTRSPGLTTSERVVVQVVEPPEPPARGSIRPIEPPKPRPQPPEISYGCALRANPAKTEVGSEVDFTAEVMPPIVGEEYFFVFDDGESSGWIGSAVAKHTYSSPGFYRPKVSVRRRGAVLATAEGRVNVASAPTKYRVFLEIDRRTAEVRQPIAFETKVEPRPEGARYAFSFGDGREPEWNSKNTLTRSFEREGTYRITPLVRVGEQTIPGDPVMVRIMPIAYRVSLTVVPDRLKPGDEATFRARLTPGNARAEYQFAFGDNISSPWTEADEATHSYPSSRSYPAFVQASIAGKVVARSPTMEIQVIATPPPEKARQPNPKTPPAPPPNKMPSPPPPEEWPTPPEKTSSVPPGSPGPPPAEKAPSPALPPEPPNRTSTLLVVIAGAAVAALGAGSYAALRHWKQPKVRLGYVSHIDTGGHGMATPTSGPVGTEIGLKPVLDSGEQQLDLQGLPILKEERVS